MIRTQIQLTSKQYAALRRVARERGVSLAEVVRSCLDAALGAEPQTQAQRYDAALRLVGAFDDRDHATDVATDHDRYLQESFD